MNASDLSPERANRLTWRSRFRMGSESDRPFGAPRPEQLRGLLLLLIGTALIAIMDALVKLMSTSLGTLQIAWGRYSRAGSAPGQVTIPSRSGKPGPG